MSDERPGFQRAEMFNLGPGGMVQWWKCNACGSSRPEYRLRWRDWKCPDCPGAKP